MNAKNDLIFVILMIAAIGFVWFFTGGVERARLNPGAFLKPPAPLGSGEVYGKFIVNTTSVSIDKNDNKSDKIQDAFNVVADELKDTQILENFSQYENKIIIKNTTYGPKRNFDEGEYLTLFASNKNNDNISVTGWQIESIITKKRIIIGGAVEIFRSGVVNSAPPLFLAPGETVIVSTGRSPIGVSFKINKCVGYFEQFQNFSPGLNRWCPSPRDEFDDFANIPPPNDILCEDFVDKIGSCEIYLSSFPVGISNECAVFVSQNINYTGCVKNHKNDLDFLGNEWRVFLGRSEELWRERREVIRLLDNEGKVVDVLTY